MLHADVLQNKVLYHDILILQQIDYNKRKIHANAIVRIAESY